MSETIGKYRAVPFRMEHAEDLESILAAAGVTAPERGGGMVENLVSVALSLAASPQSKERLGWFAASVWDHPLQREIDEAEDAEDLNKAQDLRVKKRNLYRRQPPSARNEILRSLAEQEDFKSFLNSYLSLLPGDMGKKMREQITSALASMNEQLTKSVGTTDTEKKKSTG